jgi:ATP phosphoribosyltransferase regulatory subunit
MPARCVSPSTGRLRAARLRHASLPAARVPSWRGGRYDEVGAVFTATVSAVGFRPQGAGQRVATPDLCKAPSVLPKGEDASLRTAIARLRPRAVKTVVCVLPGQRA